MYREIASADEKSISITTGINDATEATYTLHAVLAVVALPTAGSGRSVRHSPIKILTLAYITVPVLDFHRAPRFSSINKRLNSLLQGTDLSFMCTFICQLDFPFGFSLSHRELTQKTHTPTSPNMHDVRPLAPIRTQTPQPLNILFLRCHSCWLSQ